MAYPSSSGVAVTTRKKQPLTTRAKVEEQKVFAMPMTWFSVRGATRFWALALLGAAVASVTVAQAQTGDAPISNASCADVKPPVPNPQDTYGNVPLYLVAPGAPQHQSVCQATEALAAGMVDMSLGDDRVLADALDEPEPDSTTGEVSEFAYSGPVQPPPGPAPELTEGSHLYAAFIDPKTGVEYTYSSVADSLADMRVSVADWITSTVEPLLEQDASSAIAPTASNARVAAVANAAIGEPGYDTRAWKLLVSETTNMPDASTEIQEHGEKFPTATGHSGKTMQIYRLNGEQAGNDYFLVDTAYTQSPAYNPFEFVRFVFTFKIFAWANDHTDLRLTAMDPIHPTTIKPGLFDFSPQTKVTGSTETFTVGANLTGAVGDGSGVNASYSVTTTQESVVTTVVGSLGRDMLQWTDAYSGFGIPDGNGGIRTPPSTSVNSFAGRRLAIFQVPRTINDNIPAGQQAGLRFTPRLYSAVQGFSLAGLYFIHSGWDLDSSLFAPEPQFSATPMTIQVSKSKNSAATPAIVNILAQLPNGGQKVTWLAELPSFLGSNVGASGITGSGQLKVYATSSAAAGESGFILLDSSPSAATDSLRNGPLQIQVSVVP
jgi:hypothetical protein